jgi:hypothetical protein
MTAQNTTVAVERGDEIKNLRSSPLRGIKPIQPDPLDIPIERIELDPTNPGGDPTKPPTEATQSLRYGRRAGSISDSFDILGGIVYPIVVCQKENDANRYILIDGHGRLGEVRIRGLKKIRALVFAHLTVEQRICFREVLNSAQEPFDAVSIVRDLWQLAEARGLKLDSHEEIKTLVRDLPEKIRAYQDDLFMLGRWHPKAVAKLGENYKQNGQTIGVDKIRDLDKIVKALDRRHPATLARLGGERKFTLTLTQMYSDGKFRTEGTKSQQAIRAVTKSIRALPVEHEKVFRFFDEQSSWVVLENVDDAVSVQPGDLLKACKDFAALLLEVDELNALGDKERRALERTATVLDQVLGQK